MRPYRTCLECVPFVDSDGGRDECWIRCSYLVYKLHYLKSSLAKHQMDLIVLEDGRIQPPLCQLDIGRF